MPQFWQARAVAAAIPASRPTPAAAPTATENLSQSYIAIADRILDTYVQQKMKPLVEIGFMPEALSTNPEPYQHHWRPGPGSPPLFTGWSYPPKDYDKWRDLITRWVQHSVEKYGRREVESWFWEVWNEPDIGYWHGTPEEYDRLYDAAAAAVKRALPAARVGGPATTGPAGDKAAAYLKQFLEHCEKAGTPLDFITYHAKGRPAVSEGHVRMGIAKNAQDVDKQVAASRGPRDSHVIQMTY